MRQRSLKVMSTFIRLDSGDGWRGANTVRFINCTLENGAIYYMSIIHQ